MSEQDIATPENGKRRCSYRRSSHGFLGGFVLGALLGAAVTIGVGAYSHGDPGGWSRGGYDTTAASAIARAEFATDFVLSRVNADESQRQKAKAIVRDTINQLFPLKLEHQASRQAFIDALAQPSIDRAALEQIRQNEMRRADTASTRLVQAVSDIADVLTPEQRTQLIELATRLRH
jgi:Spy/CpxP family protein refolding chaperone